MKRGIVLFIGAAIVVGAVALGFTVVKGQRLPQPVNPSAYQSIFPDQLSALLQRKDFLLVNVHIPYAGQVEGTDFFVPYTDVETKVPAMLPDRQAKIVLYCQTGRMSAIAAEALVRMGYTNVVNLDGGMVAWERAGYPVHQR